ncbi:MAG: ABC transporter permease [Candidatus Thermoplasmatota archaeon]
MFDELKKICVFVKRDFRMLLTYKFAFFSMFLSMVFNLFYLVLFGAMFGDSVPAAISPYSENFISYLLVGSIGWGFLWTVMNATAVSLRSEMMMGTLESILLTRTKLVTVIAGYTIFGCFFGLLMMLVFLIVGVICFGIVVFANANVYTLIVFLFSTLLMIGFGMLFGGLTVWVKNIGETVHLIQNVTMFFCGVYFPITVLPKYLQPVAPYIPFYYSIEGLRKSLIPGITYGEIMSYVWILIALTIAFLLIGLYTLNKGLQKAKKEGSLAFY